MASDIECVLVPGAPLSRRAGKRVGSVSLSELETLRNAQDFRRVLQNGTRRRQGGIVLVQSPGLPGPPRLGLVVSRGSGNAVKRNRIKRRLRHATAELQLQPGMDYVIIANGQVAEVTYARIQGWLTRALEEMEDA